tara:strand:- start:1819 stop:3096 length:1278 start_codon:yes stop_codon:yes gene_type:complete
MRNIILLTFFLTSLFAQYQIEGRWHLVGYEDNVMYQFEDNYRYSIYSLDGNFGDLDEAGGSPNPYTILEDIITIDLFFGNIVSYQMIFSCNGQVVEFMSLENGIVHSTLFREGYDYNNNCNEYPQECFDLSAINFGECDMSLGVGWNGTECEYISGCDWVVDDIDYYDLFFNSLSDCLSVCFHNEGCEPGYIEINELCFYESDINVIQIMIDNSYASDIDLDCQGSQYCGSPNPYFDSEDFWGGLSYDGIVYQQLGDENGIVEPLELGIQQWENGRLKALDCGVYIYCQLSGIIPEGIADLTELETFRVEGNYFSGFIPESICDLEIDYDNSLVFDVSYNHLCPPYPDCINTNYEFWGQYDEECNEIGDVNFDSLINVLDIIALVSIILVDENPDYQTFIISDINSDDLLDILDIIELTNIIINN